MDNLDGLIERLRGHADAWDSGHTMSAASDDLREAATTLEALAQENARLREALEKVERWELPSTGRFWENVDGTMSDRPMGYEVCYGSNGAREYMRSIARKALGGGDGQ